MSVSIADTYFNMPEENEDIKIQEGLYEIIPDSLLRALDAESTGSKIAGICSENNILKEGDVENIGYGVGLVLLGQLRPDDLPIFLEKSFKINGDVARKIYKKVSEAIFSSLKDDLLKIYEAKPVSTEPKIPEEPQKPLAKDTYREQTE